jgi:hypothetical protein
VQRLELRVGGETFGFLDGRGVFALQLHDFGLPFRDLVASEDQKSDAGEHGGKSPDHDVGDRARAHRCLGALPQLGGK